MQDSPQLNCRNRAYRNRFCEIREPGVNGRLLRSERGIVATNMSASLLPDRDCYALHEGTVRTMFSIIWSRAVLIWSLGSVRVLHRAAQHMPEGVRTMREVVPGRLPLCHQFPAPLSRTIQPRA
jgi:hypothetical protein